MANLDYGARHVRRVLSLLERQKKLPGAREPLILGTGSIRRTHSQVIPKQVQERGRLRIL